MKKKILIVISVLLGIALILTFIPAVIDCGESVLYTKEDRQSAARLISDTVNSFEGCKLYAVKYEGDEVSQKNLEYCNSLYSWSWYLARTNGGEWEILTYGYA